MSHFYAEIEGGRSEASRTGHKSTGISGHVRGWGVGVRVRGFHDDETGKDMFRIYATGGSDGHSAEQLLALVTTDTKGRPTVEHLDA